jgi:hypothetical protein
MHKRIVWTAAALVSLGGVAVAEPRAVARIGTRPYPSIFEAWNPAEKLFEKDGEKPFAADSADETLAQHAFAFVNFNTLGVRPATPGAVLTSDFNPKSVEVALARRAKILQRNPYFVVLASIPYRNAPGARIPEDSPLWLRDAAGHQVPTHEDQRGNQFYLDYRKPEVQEAIAANCKALIETKVFDGCMFDFWGEHIADDPVDPNGDVRRQLIAKVRSTVGDAAILVANTNGKKPEKTGPYLNGMYMEGFGSAQFAGWRVAASDFDWGRAHLHQPAFTLLEGWPTDEQGRAELSRMREVTTLALTLSNGYALYADHNHGPVDHAHDWYRFWDAKLGRPKEPPRKADGDGPFRREFEQGTAVFNPPEHGPAKFNFSDERISAATGERGHEFIVAPADGDMFLRP